MRNRQRNIGENYHSTLFLVRIIYQTIWKRYVRHTSFLFLLIYLIYLHKIYMMLRIGLCTTAKGMEERKRDDDGGCIVRKARLR